MSNPIANYMGDGSTKRWSFAFDYLHPSFVKVTVDSVPATFTLIDKRTVELTTPPQAGLLVTIRRDTDASKRLVHFKDGSILKASDLDASTLQALHIAEEGRAAISDAVSTTEDGQWEGRYKRLTRLADPIEPQDAVNKRWAETSGTSFVLQAAQHKDDANLAKMVSVGASQAATQAQSLAAQSAVKAGDSEIKAKSSEDAAAVSASQSASSATSANTAKQAVDTAVQTIQSSMGRIEEVNSLVNEVKGARIPVGAIIPFAVPVGTVIAGWLPMGSSFDKNTYKKLALLYPTGVLPDLTDDFIRGAGAARPTDTRESWATEEHSHDIMEWNNPSAGTDANAYTIRGTFKAGTGGTSFSAFKTTKQRDGNRALETRPRNVAYPFYIKALDAVDQPEVLNAMQLTERIAALETPLVPPAVKLMTSVGCPVNAPVLMDVTATSFTQYQSSSTPSVGAGTRAWTIPQYAGYKVVNISCHSIQSSTGEANRISVDPYHTGKVTTVYETFVAGGSRVGLYITYRKE